MSELYNDCPAWLNSWMDLHDISLWGAADLQKFSTPKDETGQRFSFAISFAVSMDPHIMAGIQHGPNQAYADEYARANKLINELSGKLSTELKNRSFRSKALKASERTDKINIKGDFPHKTAATRAGLGWIGRHCQLITHKFGPWIRLGTVFTNMELPCGPPAEHEHCGRCTLCVDACPAKALKGAAWYPGIPREEILDVNACDKWKKDKYYQFHKGHNCGICSAACPYGLKILKKGK